MSDDTGGQNPEKDLQACCCRGLPWRVDFSGALPGCSGPRATDRIFDHFIKLLRSEGLAVVIATHSNNF